MKSIRCPQCELIQWETASACKRCGRPFDAAAGGAWQVEETGPVAGEHLSALTAAPPMPGHESATMAAPPWAEHRGKKKIGLAVLSLVTGILSVPPVFSFVLLIFGGILALLFGVPGFVVGAIISFSVIPTAIISGIVALNRTRNRPFEFGGKGLAIGGIACGAAGFAVIPIIAAIAIPNLMAARRAANEGSAIQSLRILSGAQETYLSTVGNGNCGEMNQLRSAGLIGQDLALGSKSGYKFELAFDDNKHGCWAYATPLTSSSGTRSFLMSRDGVIHAGKKNGALAELKDPPLED